MFLFRCCLNSGCSHHSSPEHQVVEDLVAVDKSKLHSRLLPSTADDGKWFADYNGCTQYALTAQPLILDPIGENYPDESQLPQPTKEMYRSGESGFGETSSLHMDQSVESAVIPRTGVEKELSMSPSKDSLFVSSLEEQKPSEDDSCSELSPEVKYIADAIYFQSSVFAGDKLLQSTQDFDGSSLSNNSASIVSESAVFHQQSHNYMPVVSDSFKPSIYELENHQPELVLSSPLQGLRSSALGPSMVNCEHTSHHSDIVNQVEANLNHVPATAPSSDDDEDSSPGDMHSVYDDSHVHFVYSFTDKLPAVEKSITWEHSFCSKVEVPSTSIPEDLCTFLEASPEKFPNSTLTVIDSDRIENVIDAEDLVSHCNVNTKLLPNSFSLPEDAASIQLCKNNVPTPDDYHSPSSVEPSFETMKINDFNGGSVCTKLYDGCVQRMHEDNYESDGCGIGLLIAQNSNSISEDLSEALGDNFEVLSSSPNDATESRLSCVESQVSSDLAGCYSEVDSYVENIIRDAVLSFNESSTDMLCSRPTQCLRDYQDGKGQSIVLSSSFTVSDYILEQQESILDKENVDMIDECRNQDDCEFNVGDQLLLASEFDCSEHNVGPIKDVENTLVELSEDNVEKCLKNAKSSDPFDIHRYYICRGNNQKVDSHPEEAELQRKLSDSQITYGLSEVKSSLDHYVEENSVDQFSAANHCEDDCDRGLLSELQLLKLVTVSSTELGEAEKSKQSSLQKDLVIDQLSDRQDLEDCDTVDSLLDELVEKSDNQSSNMVVATSSLESDLCLLENLQLDDGPQLEWPVPPVKLSSRKFSPTSVLVDIFFQNYVVPVNEEASNPGTVDEIQLLASADNISSALDQLELELQSVENDGTTDEPTLTVQVLKSDDHVVYESIHNELLECHPCLSLNRSPRRKKSVRFADAFGHCLESVRHIENSTTAPSLPAVVHNVLPSLQAATDRRARWAERYPRQGITPTAWRCETRAYLHATFTQPGTLPDFTDRVRTSRVVLESCTFDDSAFAISGVVRVANIAFHKVVSVRYTLDSWTTQSDVDAEYVPRSNDGTTDRFAFTVILPPRRVFGVGSQVEFAICYSAGDCDDVCETHWDNNMGSNYVIECCYSGNPSTVQTL